MTYTKARTLLPSIPVTSHLCSHPSSSLLVLFYFVVSLGQ